MSEYITQIRTSQGKKKIDFNALANKPSATLSLDENGNAYGFIPTSDSEQYSKKTYYAKHNSNTQPPVNGWSESIVDAKGAFLWIKNEITYPNGDVQIDFSVSSQLNSVTSASEIFTSKGATVEEKMQELSGMVSNPNLIDNWWFGSGVINQRGVTSESAEYSFVIDRWRTGQNSLFELKNGYVKITGAMFEITEILDVLGKTVTASVKLHDGIILSASGIVTNTGAWHSILSKPEMYVAVTAGGLIEFCVRDCEAEAVKLEYGSVSTLANDHAPDYATELLECQRYYQKLLTTGYGVLTSTGHCQFSLPLTTNMRQSDVSILGNIDNLYAYTPNGVFKLTVTGAWKADTGGVEIVGICSEYSGESTVCITPDIDLAVTADL